MTPEEQKELDNYLINADKRGKAEARPLRWAAGHGHTETVKLLLAAGANVHADNDWALRMASNCGHTDTVKVLLVAGANVHAVGDYALRGAAKNDHTETVKILLAAGADVHAWDDWALRFAARNGNTETMQVLARHIFVHHAWRGKSREEIEAQAKALYDQIASDNPQPECLLPAAKILANCAIDYWQRVRPAPPKLQISPLPAHPRPL